VLSAPSSRYSTGVDIISTSLSTTSRLDVSISASWCALGSLRPMACSTRASSRSLGSIKSIQNVPRGSASGAASDAMEVAAAIES